MQKTPLACIVLAAGQGTRMKSDIAKVLHPVAGAPMLRHVLASAESLTPEKIVVVIGPDMETVAKAAAPHATVVQKQRQGTADAVKTAKLALPNFSGDVLVLYGDTPLVTPASLEALRAQRAVTEAAIVVTGFRPAQAGGYGRLVCDADGHVLRIVEALDATPDELAIDLCNGGIMLFDGARMWALIEAIGNRNAKGEFYLTDAIALAVAARHRCAMVEFPVEEVTGVNDRVDLAQAEKLMQQRLRRQAMAQGATLLDPDTVYFSVDTKLGRDVTVGPNVVFGPGVVVGDRVDIRAFCHLEKVRVANGAQIGPFARLRPGSSIGEGAHIGNFVEIKNARIGAGTKINHLTYVGDAEVGQKSNLGAGTITCNYDGFRKHVTKIGDGVFIGSNTALVAPVDIGSGAFVGAGSVITENVPADTLAVARGRQVNLENWAKRFRDGQEEKKG